MGVIRNSDVQTIRDVAKAVQAYAEGIKGDIDKLVSRHGSMNGSWSGEQYDQLTNVLSEAQKILTKQANALKVIAEEVRADADRLAIAQGITIK